MQVDAIRVIIIKKAPLYKKAPPYLSKSSFKGGGFLINAGPRQENFGDIWGKTQWKVMILLIKIVVWVCKKPKIFRLRRANNEKYV